MKRPDLTVWMARREFALYRSTEFWFTCYDVEAQEELGKVWGINEVRGGTGLWQPSPGGDQQAKEATLYDVREAFFEEMRRYVGEKVSR